MRLLIIICMIISLLITPWSLVFGAAGAAMGLTGAIAALMQSMGYVISVQGDTYTTDDVSIGIGDMLEAYAVSIGSTVAATFPFNAITLIGNNVLSFTPEIYGAVKDMLESLSSDGDVSYPIIQGQTTVQMGSGQVYRMPYSFVTTQGRKVELNYSLGTQSDYYVYFTRQSGEDYVYIDYFGTGISKGTSYLVKIYNSAGTSYEYLQYYYRESTYGGHTYLEVKIDLGRWGGPAAGQYKYATDVPSSDNAGCIAPYYYGGSMTETATGVTIAGSSPIPSVSEDKSILITGIPADVDTVDAMGEQILDLVLDGALDIVTQLPESDPISPDLFDVFPFCLPYDMYRLLHVFDAEPVAPVIHWPFQIDSLGIDYELVVDLSEWDSIASLLRHLETIVFLVGLALITRKWIGAE